MAFLPQRLYEGQPGTSNATLFTVPTTVQNPTRTVQQLLLKQVIVANTTASAATLTLNLVPIGGAAGASNQIVPAVSYAANSVTLLNLGQVMNVGDFLAGLQGTGGALTITVSGFYHV